MSVCLDMSRLVSPQGAVLVAGLTLHLVVSVLPDDSVSLSWHALWTARHTVRAVVEVGALCTVVRTLERRRDGVWGGVCACV